MGLTHADAGTPPALATTAAPAAASPSVSPPTYPKPTVVLAGLEHGVQRWDRPITVHVHNGTLLSVLTDDETTGSRLGGVTSPKGWAAEQTEVPNRTYRVVADVRGLDGTITQLTKTVRTSEPEVTVDTDVTPFGGATVGVGSTVRHVLRGRSPTVPRSPPPSPSRPHAR